MGADDREVHAERFDAESIYSELAVRIDVATDANGVSVEALWDRDGLHVIIGDKYGSSRSVRLVVAPELPVTDAPVTAVKSPQDANPPVSERNWRRR